MSVRVYEPKCSVILRKNIGRANVAGSIVASTRFKGTSRQIDLTPWLGDAGAVVVSKSVRQPSGMFSITLADKMEESQLESLYALIEPMDIVEIRMAHDTSLYAGSLPQHMPMIMRGLVTDIRRGRVMDGDGRPRRAVTIGGQDYGKILQIMQIAYLPNEVTGQLLLSYFKFFANYGVGSEPNKDASTFVREVVGNVITPFLNDMRAAAQASGTAQGVTPIQNILVDAKVPTGIISPFGVNQWPGGTVYDLLQYYGDVGPWNELYVEDREDAPYLVYRPTPFQDSSGKFIQEPYKSTASARPPVVVVPDVDLIDEDVGRTDAGVANYYWVDSPRFLLNSGQLIQAMFAGQKNAIFLTDYQNSSPFLYGFRRMQTQTQQGARYDGQLEEKFNQETATALGFVNARRATLIANNRDNVVLEAGTMDLRGNEAIRPGSTVRLISGSDAAGDAAGKGLASERYAFAVTHQFLPYRSFTTKALFDRGTGFIVRAQRGTGTNSPYLSEMSPGGVYA